jgi:hypothetical protein
MSSLPQRHSYVPPDSFDSLSDVWPNGDEPARVLAALTLDVEPFHPTETDSVDFARQTGGGFDPDRDLSPSERLFEACESDLAFQLGSIPGGGRS